MIRFIMRYAFLLTVLFSVVLFIACANMASPSGGEYDLDPPVVVKSNPGFNALHVNTNKIVIEFDENVIVDKPTEKVIITPPQRNLPKIYAVNRRIFVELKDTLLPNTTYTIDFTDAIADNNENNPLDNFALSFSTGSNLDSLCMSGKVLDASNLEPMKGMYVGIHSDLSDTAFTQTKFLRISRTNDAGFFSVKGIAPGKYKIYALDDINRDYMYDNPSESLAFLDSIFVPTFEPATRTDTVFNKIDPKKVDSLITKSYTRFLPDDIVLRSFKSKFQRQYLQNITRTPQKLNIIFGAPTEFPTIKPINVDDIDKWAVLERNVNNDTLTYWIKEPEAISRIDTLAFSMTYLKSDSLNNPIPVIDTLRFVDRTRKKTEKELQKEQEKLDKLKEEGKEPPITFLSMKHNISTSMDVYKNITFEFNEPIIENIDSLQRIVRLQQKVDTLYNDITFQLSPDSLNPRLYTLKHKWEYGKEYKVQIDSAAIHSIFGLWNNTIDQPFKIKEENEYGKLLVRVSGVQKDMPAFIELLDKSDKPIRKSRVKDNIAGFNNVSPGEYYMRITLDANDNGVWDTGDYEKKLEPEMVCYYNGAIGIRSFSEVEQDFEVRTDNLTEQKPLEITKNKPQKKETKREQLEREEREKNEKKNTNQNTGSRNAGFTTGSGTSLNGMQY